MVCMGAWPDAKATIVGLEKRTDIGAALAVEERGLSWPERRLDLEQRVLAEPEKLCKIHDKDKHLKGILGEHRSSFHFLTHSEYRALVGDKTWELETSEPWGPWCK